MEDFAKFRELIENKKRIVISTHQYPDADGIGSEVALALGLISYGKNVTCVNDEPLLERYKYLDPQQIIISYEEYMEKFQNDEIDLFIVVDTNNHLRIGPKLQTTFNNAKANLFIDHHPASNVLKSSHFIDSTSAATGQIVGEILTYLGVKITKEMALALYTAILIDTSSFRYPTVTGNTHRLVAKLVDTGIKPPQAYNGIYGTKKIPHMQLLGKVLANAENNKTEEIAWISLKDSTLRDHQVDIEDTHSFINYLLVLDNIKVALMFRDMGGTVKISLRSAGNVDVGIIAAELGGGGHNHSAATCLDGDLASVIPSVISRIELILKRANVAVIE